MLIAFLFCLVFVLWIRIVLTDTWHSAGPTKPKIWHVDMTCHLLPLHNWKRYLGVQTEIVVCRRWKGTRRVRKTQLDIYV